MWNILQLYLRDGLETEEYWECCCPVFRGGLPFLRTKTPFQLVSDSFAEFLTEDGRKAHSPPCASLCSTGNKLEAALAWQELPPELDSQNQQPQCLGEVHTLTSFPLNSYAYIPNIYPSKHYPAYGFQLQSASCLPLPGWIGGLSKGPWMPKASDLLSSKTSSYHRNRKGHRNSLQPLSAKGINVQTKPLAISKINPSSQSPGAQSATYALHRNACSRGSWAAVGSWEPKQSSPFDHRNATLINYLDSPCLKALKISTGRSRGGLSPASPLDCPLQLIPTYNRCHFKKMENLNSCPGGHTQKLPGNHLCHKTFSRDTAARNKENQQQ